MLRQPLRSPLDEPLQSRAADADDAIRGTDDDALTSRLSALALGYIPPLSDPYTQLFTRSGRIPPLQQIKRDPLINVGTHHRSWSVDRLVETWLARGGERQVVGLGAGSDARFWRLSPVHANLVKYIELDFPHITSTKARRIVTNKTLLSAISPRPNGLAAGEKPYKVSQGGARLDGDVYGLVPLDLRQQVSQDVLSETLLPLLDPTVPTLFLAECLFCYMAPKESAAVIEWFGKVFGGDSGGGCMGVVYEMCGLNDSFGAVMKRNLMSRAIPLPGAIYASPEDQASRFTRAGWDYATGVSLKQIRTQYIPKEELERISKLEFLDEVEELELVLEHYCVAWGVKLPASVRKKVESGAQRLEDVVGVGLR